jgi:4-amino-4-deoxy-L-arabinose transferase-like glycosyltransferase
VTLRAVISLFLIFAIFSYFFVFSSVFLDRLALDTNESFEGLHALKVLQHKKMAGGLPWMFMSLEYEGHLVAYLLVPVFAIFGPSVFMARFIYVLFSLVSLICIFYVCKRWFNRGVALTAIFLLGINTTFIRCTRVGSLRDEILQISLIWLGIALIQLYIDRKNKFYLYASGFIFGLALWAKIMFLGFLLAAVIAFSFFGKRGINFLRNRIFLSKKDLTGFLLMFVVGSSPFVMFNIMLKNETFRYLWRHFWNPTVYGYNNLAVFKNISLRVGDLYKILLNGIGPETLSYTKNYFHLILFLVSLLVVLFYIVFSKQSPISKNKLKFLIFAYSILFILTCFVPQNRIIEHVILLFPFVQIMEAVAIFLFFLFFKNIIFPLVFILTILCPYVVLEFYTISRFLSDIDNRRGIINFSSMINDIASYAQKNKIGKLFAMSENLLDCNVDFITNLEVGVREIQEVYPYSVRLSNDSLNNIVKSIYNREMSGLSKIYIVIWRGGSLKDYSSKAFDAFSKIALDKGRKVNLVKAFASKIEPSSFELYEIK